MAVKYVLLVTLLSFQYASAQRMPRQAAPIPKGNAAAIATFSGKFKSADKKFVTVEVDEGQTLRMFITGATKFIRDGRPAKASEFVADEPVVVDASRDVQMNLLAVRVENVPAGNRDTGKPRSVAPPTPPDIQVRIRRFGGLSYSRTANLGIPSESK